MIKTYLFKTSLFTKINFYQLQLHLPKKGRQMGQTLKNYQIFPLLSPVFLTCLLCYPFPCQRSTFLTALIVFPALCLPILKTSSYRTGVSNLRPAGCMQPRVAMNAGQHKIVNLLKTLVSFITQMCTFSVLVITNLGPAR